VFTDIDLITHTPLRSDKQVEFAGKNRKNANEDGGMCSSYFVSSNPSLGTFDEAEGPILCPNLKCKFRLGTYNWAGAQCSCGEWVVPALMMTKSKIDIKPFRQKKEENKE